MLSFSSEEGSRSVWASSLSSVLGHYSLVGRPSSTAGAAGDRGNKNSDTVAFTSMRSGTVTYLC